MYFTFGFTMIHDENPTQITVITDKNAHTKTEDAFTTAVSKNLFSCRVMAFFIIRFRFHLFSGRFLGRLFQFTENAFACRGNAPGKCAGEMRREKFFFCAACGQGKFFFCMAYPFFLCTAYPFFLCTAHCPKIFILYITYYII